MLAFDPKLINSDERGGIKVVRKAVESFNENQDPQQGSGYNPNQGQRRYVQCGHQ